MQADRQTYIPLKRQTGKESDTNGRRGKERDTERQSEDTDCQAERQVARQSYRDGESGRRKLERNRDTIQGDRQAVK